MSWNILHGGGSRLPRLLKAIEQYEPDILALQEVRRGDSEVALRGGLAELGLSNLHLPETLNARENTLLVASKLPFDASLFPNDDRPHHILRCDFDALSIYAVHFPQKKAQVPLFDALLSLPASELKTPALLIGDINCGIPFEDSETKTFENTHLFQQLLHRGWTDLWRTRHPNAREYSWVSTRRKNGFRYDQALGSPSLAKQMTEVRYDHGVREDGASDHSALIVDFAVGQ